MRAAVVTPLSGPLAAYGQAGAAALRLWARSGGGPSRHPGGVRLSVHDSGGGLGPALRAALDERPDLLFGPYGSGQVAAMARGTDRLIWNHGAAAGGLDRFRHVVSVLSPADSYFAGAVELLHHDVATVTLLHGETGFGREVAAGAERRATGRGLLVDRRGFRRGGAARAARRAPGADVVMVAAGMDDERAAAHVLLSRPWRARVLVSAGEREPLAEFGGAREGLLGPAQWSAGTPWEPDEGPDPEWFVRGYQELTGTSPPYPAAQAFAAGVIAARCVREAGDLDDGALRAAAASLSCTTLFGRFRLDPAGVQVGHQMLTVQWQDGRRRVVWPPELARGARPRIRGRSAGLAASTGPDR